MITQIDNNQGIFWIQCMGWSTDKYFCNLIDLVECCQEIHHSQPYEIRRLWNYKFKRISNKEIIALLEAAHLDASFFKPKKKKQ